MKITKRQLRRIIKEEKTRLLQEMTDDEHFNAAAAGIARSEQSVWGVLQQAIDTAVEKVGDRSVRSYLESWVRGYHR
mgnify:CR=1 FL=1